MAPKAQVPRRYTSEELLALRGSLPFVTCVIKNLNQHPDLGCVVRLPVAAREDPEHFSCKSSTLVDITNQRTVAGRVAESSGESEPQPLADALGKQESSQLHQWSLRARSSSDRSSQPRPAPISIAAQRSENFQKFYRAVVSPTHVRVTAGGRIVPNTRATAPPPLDWDKAFEPIKQAPAEPNNSQTVSWQLSSGYTTVVPNVFAPPFIPLPHGNSQPMPAMASQLQQPFPGAEHGTIGHVPMPHLATDAGGNPLQSGLIKISPPAQFDQSRPFLYNGQWIYPVSAPPANAPLPITMLGNPGFFTPPMASAGFMQPQFPIQMAGMSHPVVFPAGHHAPMMAAGVAQQSEGSGLVPPLLPMPSMGLNAELLKAQVSSMRFQLKQVEDQISNTKGQADQLFMEQQRTFLLSQIGNMEAMIEHQRAHESRGANRNGDVGGGKFNETSKQLATKNGPAPELDTQLPLVVSSSMANSSKNGETNETHNAASKNSTKTHPEPGTKSRLSIAAALAPPFQPRSQVLVEQNNQGAPFDSPPSPDFIAMLDANPQMQAEIEAQLRASALATWSGPSSAANQPYLTLGNGPILYGEQAKKHTQPGNMHRSNTFHEPMKTVVEEKFIMPPGSVPYLVGTLPNGLNASSARTTDFMYSRPLTEEEIRARYLYWGKAPRSVQSGLPKFDGKDFYPPSPVKGKVDLAATSKEAAAVHRVVTPPPMQNPSFEHLFASPWTSGYRTPPPATAPSSDWVTMGPIPAQTIFQNGSQTSHEQGSPFKASMGHSSVGEIEATRQAGGHYRPDNALHSSVGPTEEDFSGLFLERGAPGYRSPSPPTDKIKETIIYYKKRGEEIPMTPENPEQSHAEGEGDDDEARTQGSWEQNDLEPGYTPNAEVSHSQSVVSDDANSTSTIEINLGQRVPISVEQSYQERVDNFRKTEHQTQFLQNILKKEAPMTGSALSGTVSSATAQGYLPLYFGSAAASLTPNATNLQYSDTDGEHIGSKRDSAKSVTGPAPGMASIFLPENRPFNSERYQRAVPLATSAEGYMRYLSNKDENDKQIIEQGWNANTTGTGPITGSDW